MAQWKTRSGRTATGAKTSSKRKRRIFERGLRFLEARIGPGNIKTVRTRGGSVKRKIVSEEKISVSDKGKTKVTKILSVEENPANLHYVRRNVLTKGAVVKTEMGRVRITTRPGQQGTLNGKLLEDKS